jgi:hypothetical protein
VSTHILDAARAAWTSEAATGTSFYDRPTLALDGAGSDEKRAYLWFPNPIGPLGEQVLSAELRLYLANSWSGTITITAKRITETWKQRTVKWGSAGNTPAVTSTNSASVAVTNGSAGDLVTLDLSAMLEDVANGAAWYGVRLELDSGSGRLHSPLAATVTYRPQLVVDLSVLPDAPDNLRPDGDNYATEDEFPVFKWAFGSGDVNAYQAQSRVLVSYTEGDASQGDAYDSGWVTNDVSNWDPEDDVPAFADSDDLYWVVAVRDQNGLESPYSEEAHFQRQAKADLMIADPAVDDDDVEDSTPTITWYHDGASTETDQKLVRIRVYEGTGNELGDLLYERPWAAQTQDEDENGNPVGYDSYTIPSTVPSRRGDGAPIISTPNAKYAVEVAVRDSYSRPDSEYASDTRYFDYVPGTSVTAPTNLTATATPPFPYVNLAWSRASTPDYFVILRDGVAIAEVEGEDVYDSGTSYSWRDYTALPGVSYTYSVRAKTTGTGVSAAASATAVATAPVGVWLCYDAGVAGTATDIVVCILGDNRIAHALAERSETFEPLNRRDAVRIVSRIGGFHGKVSGTLSGGWQSFDIDDLLEDIETVFAQHSTDTLRLVFGKRNIGVNVGNLVIDQHPGMSGEDAMADIEFDFWQTDDFTVEVN